MPLYLQNRGAPPTDAAETASAEGGLPILRDCQERRLPTQMRLPKP